MPNFRDYCKDFEPIDRYLTAPDWWLTHPEKAVSFLESLKDATVRTIGKSAGGRDIIAIEYGEKEPLDCTTDNLASALASTASNPDPTKIFPPAFYGTKRRRKPVVVLQGAIHGGELTGTVASLNLCRVIETGKDLRGKSWPSLQKLARKARICILPWTNPDGTARWPFADCNGMPDELYSPFTAGILKDGTRLRYPAHKNIYPIPPESVAYMGSYFNDNGYNLQYDYTTIERQPETKAWMRYYLDERPDGVVIWHCDSGSMISSPESFLPEGYQHQTSRIGGAVRQRLVRDGYRIGRLSWAALVGMGSLYLSQMNAVYHHCGALPVMCEAPAGTVYNPMTCDELLDIGLITIEEILLYAHADGLRPYEFWTKVKKQLGYED